MSKPAVPEITVTEALKLLSGPNPPRLIDVREPDEWSVARIAGAELLPLSQWPAVALEKLTDKSQPLLVQCHHGGRSAKAVAWLLQQGFTNAINLAGGIDAWSTQVDATVPRYQ
ncbi:MAG: rhodanese-like domain-containing protein [Chthoniobacteraceae bacterium]